MIDVWNIEFEEKDKTRRQNIWTIIRCRCGKLQVNWLLDLWGVSEEVDYGDAHAGLKRYLIYNKQMWWNFCVYDKMIRYGRRKQSWNSWNNYQEILSEWSWKFKVWLGWCCELGCLRRREREREREPSLIWIVSLEKK